MPVLLGRRELLRRVEAYGGWATARARDETNGRVAHGYSRSHVVTRKAKKYKRVGKSKVLTPAGVNSMITRRVMAWKSYHHLNDLTVALTGALTNPGCIYLDYTNIPPYKPASTDAQESSLMASRQSQSVFADRIHINVSCRFTHNHAVNVRFIVFFNNTYTESILSSGGVPTTQPTNFDNLFKGFLTREDETVNVNARIASNQKFNQDLVVQRKGMRSPGLLLDKSYYISPFQSPSGSSGGDADTLSLRQFNFNLPLKMYWNWEAVPVDTAGVIDMKKGKLICIALVTSADPSNTQNSGNVQMQFRTSLVFRENS